MLILWQNDALELQQIGEQLQIGSGALTPVLKRMEKMGLLQRSRNPQNERALQIRLTQSGWAMRATAAEKVQVNRHISLKSGMAETEIQALKQELVQLRQQLNSAL
jgi:DNA-binding MarR family transcriptional regulator